MKKTIRVLVAVLVMALLFTGCGASMAEAAASGDAAEMGTASLMSTMLMFVPRIAIIYFLVIKPDNKRKKQAQEMRDAIEVGDKITTIGGMIGRVVHVTSDTITFECGEDRVRIEIAKWGVSKNDGRGSKEKSDSEEVLNG